MTDDPKPPRNYADEAARIVAGESMLLPEKAHLVAMAGQVESAARNVRTLTTAIASLMLQASKHQLVVSAEKLQAVLDTRTHIQIIQHRDGALEFRRIALPVQRTTEEGEAVH